jgi:hypothetical protein
MPGADANGRCLIRDLSGHLLIMTTNSFTFARILRDTAALLALACGAITCGGDTTNPPACTGASCACPAGSSCEVTTQICGASCTLACGAQATCVGACGESCSVDCGEQATCSLTLGASGSASCKAGSTCDVTCTGSCSISCADSAACRLKCTADDAFQAVSGGAGCP